MEIERKFEMYADRYKYDMGMCCASEGFAQVDTTQDASYFGTWANPFTLQIVSYCEGDVTIETGKNNRDFIQGILRLIAWNIAGGYWRGIDPGWYPEAIALRFTQLGLGMHLH
jgi:hypothetical protein